MPQKYPRLRRTRANCTTRRSRLGLVCEWVGNGAIDLDDQDLRCGACWNSSVLCDHDSHSVGGRCSARVKYDYPCGPITTRTQWTANMEERKEAATVKLTSFPVCRPCGVTNAACDNAKPKCGICTARGIKCSDERKPRALWREDVACWTCRVRTTGKHKITTPCVPSMVDGQCCQNCTEYGQLPESAIFTYFRRNQIYFTCDKIPGGQCLTYQEKRALQNKLDREGIPYKRIWNEQLSRYEDGPKKAEDSEEET